MNVNNFFMLDYNRAKNPNLIEQIKELIDFGKDPSWNQNYALRQAVELDRVDVVKFLLQDSRVNPKVWNNYIVSVTVTNNNLEMLKVIIEDGRIDPSFNNNYEVLRAETKRKWSLLELLKQDTRVQICSYINGQNFHNQEEMLNLKKTKPYLFI